MIVFSNLSLKRGQMDFDLPPKKLERLVNLNIELGIVLGSILLN